MLLKDQNIDFSQLPNWCDRNDYMMMLIGFLPSPLGPRRKPPTAQEFIQFGTWSRCDNPPSEGGWYILHGIYKDDENDEPNESPDILPAFYSAADNVWDTEPGVWTKCYLWMDIPFLPEVWAAAQAYGRDR